MSGSCFLFCFVCFFCFKMFLCLCFSDSCLALLGITLLDALCFASSFLVVVVFAWVFCYLLIFDYLSKTSLKDLEIPKTPKRKNIEKKEHFDKSSYHRLHYLLKTLKIVASAKKKQHKNKVKTGPSIS